MAVKKSFIWIIVFWFFLWAIASCSPPPKPRLIKEPPLAFEPRPELVAVPMNATATMTPFLPQGVIPQVAETVEAGNKSPWGNYLPPSIWPPTEIPPPLSPLKIGEGNIPILLLGDDQRDDPTFRTDAIILLVLKPKQGRASMVSFPRDLYVYIPGWTMQRINIVMERGGFDLMATTFEYNFGVRPPYYARINFGVLKQIIDDLGGVDIYLSQAVSDSVGGDPTRTVPAGWVHMDGDLADWYVRARWLSSDFERTRRHKEVLFAVFNKIISVEGISKVPDLYQKYIQNVDTNITLSLLTQWLPLAASLRDSSQLETYHINEEHVTVWQIPTSGSWVLLPNRNLIVNLLQDALR